jgi:hypothetical protein
MLHACFTPIALCFVYTLWRFYAFSGTNLLTRFCCFYISKKLHRKYSRNWMKRKPNFLFFPTRRRSPKQRRRRARGWPHHGVARVSHGRATRWCGPLVHPLTSPFCLYILFEAKTLNSSVSIHEKFHSAAAIKDQFWGTEVSVPTSCRDGELPPEPSPSTPRPSPLLLLSPMMRRE